MFKEVVRGLETGDLAIIGLLAFVVAFLLVTLRVVLMKKSEREHHKNMPLHDSEDVQEESK